MIDLEDRRTVPANYREFTHGYLSITKDDGTLMKFHSHQLRDTFAVTQLLSGTSMQDLSQMLAHKSVKITEKYYSPWVPERQAALERRRVARLLFPFCFSPS
jgi:integrase